MHQIQKIIGLAPSSTSQLIDELVKKGLVQRNTNTDDRRVIELSLTDNANNFIKSTESQVVRRYQEVVSLLGEEDAQTLLCLIQKTNKLLGYRKDENND